MGNKELKNKNKKRFPSINQSVTKWLKRMQKINSINRTVVLVSFKKKKEEKKEEKKRTVVYILYVALGFHWEIV